jgi:hypothetical protein
MTPAEALLDEEQLRQVWATRESLCKPHAEIMQVGRWTWRVSIRDGCLIYGADGYGRRELDRYLEREERRAEPVIITAS